MALNYRDYYNQALAEINPFMQQGVADTKAALADQGILASTAGQGSLGDLRSRYLAQAAGLGAERAQADRAFGENQRQFNANMGENQRQFGVSSGLRAYELQNSSALAKGQLTGNFKGIKFPNQPSFFRNLYGAKYLPPKPSSGPYGDPKEQWEGHTEGLGKTLDARNLDFQMADAAAARDLEQQRLDLQRQQMQYEQSQNDQQTDPWSQIGAYLSETTAVDKDNNPANGIQRAYLPSDILNTVNTTFGIDVIGEAKGGNPRAIAAVKLLYPKTWQYRLGETTVKYGQAGQDVWRNADGTQAAQQDWRPEPYKQAPAFYSSPINQTLSQRLVGFQTTR
jgi:hypothetical protein